MWLFIHSLVIYITNFVLVLSVRSLVRRFSSKDFYPYCAEVLSSFLMVANTHENGNVYGQYGIGLYSVCLFTLMMAYPGVCDCLANPILVFDRWWNKKMSLADSVLKIMAQVTGALLAARYMTWLWKTIALSEYQVARANYLSLTCDSANKVSVPEAMMVELMAASVLRIFASYSVGGQYYQRYFNALATIFVILAGLDWTGSMINPALATAMTYNCENHPFYEHLLVYWVAPFTGSILSDYVEDYLHGAGWRDKDQVSGEEQQAVKTNRKRKTKRKSSRSKKSSWDQTALSVNNVSPKKRKQKEANSNSNSQRKVNVGGN